MTLRDRHGNPAGRLDAVPESHPQQPGRKSDFSGYRGHLPPGYRHV